MKNATKNNYKNRLSQKSRGTNINLNQQHQINQPRSTQNIISEISSANKIEISNLNEKILQPEQPPQNQEILGEQNQIQEKNESYKQNMEAKKEDFKLRQINVTNKNRGIGPTSPISAKENHSNISVPGIINKTNNYKNMSRNGTKNIKFNQNLNERRNDIRNKFSEDTDKKNHTRAKSYFRERKDISNYLPQQLDVKKRLSHSVEIKRKTIVRGDKYNNIQITHIISASKPTLEKYNFHILEKLSTVELNKKPLDLANIKLYIKTDPNAKSFYNTSCRNVPLRSVEKVLKTVHYQHAGGRGMTNLITNNLNKKYYQSGIVQIPLKEIKKTPTVKIISEFRSPPHETNRNFSYGDKYNTNYKFNNKTYDVSKTQGDNKQINQPIVNSKFQPTNKKENEEKNKFSEKNYNNQRNIKNIASLTNNGNIYPSKTYTNNKYNTYKPIEDGKKQDKKIIVVNTNRRLNQNKINISNIPTRKNLSQDYKKDINIKENITIVKKEIENKENLNEIPAKTDSELKDNKESMEKSNQNYINIFKPLLANKINDVNKNIQGNENKISPKTNAITIEKINEKNNNQNAKNIENRTYANRIINSNTKPSINTRNINEPSKKVITNLNINKPISTNNYINNRSGNKYQNSNVSKVTSISKRPVNTQNYQTYNSTINKKDISQKIEPQKKLEPSEAKRKRFR